MIYRVIIDQRLPGMNEYSDAQRGGAGAGATMKRDTESEIGWLIRAQLHGLQITQPVNLIYVWCEPNTRRDKDNIRTAEKFVQDALVSLGVLKGDGWKYIRGSHHDYTVDAKKPRLELYIVEQPV